MLPQGAGFRSLREGLADTGQFLLPLVGPLLEIAIAFLQSLVFFPKFTLLLFGAATIKVCLSREVTIAVETRLRSAIEIVSSSSRIASESCRICSKSCWLVGSNLSIIVRDIPAWIDSIAISWTELIEAGRFDSLAVELGWGLCDLCSRRRSGRRRSRGADHNVFDFVFQLGGDFVVEVVPVEVLNLSFCQIKEERFAVSAASRSRNGDLSRTKSGFSAFTNGNFSDGGLAADPPCDLSVTEQFIPLFYGDWNVGRSRRALR